MFVADLRAHRPSANCGRLVIGKGRVALLAIIDGRCHGAEPMFRIHVADRTDVLVDTERLLHDHEPAARCDRQIGTVGVQHVTVRGSQSDCFAQRTPSVYPRFTPMAASDNNPPSMVTALPLMYEARSEARNATIADTSSGVAARRIGSPLMTSRHRVLSPKRSCARRSVSRMCFSVSTGPGLTATTRTPWRMLSPPSERENMISAALAQLPAM